MELGPQAVSQYVRRSLAIPFISYSRHVQGYLKDILEAVSQRVVLQRNDLLG